MKVTGENRSNRGKNLSQCHLSTTNPTWTDPGSDPGLRGGSFGGTGLCRAVNSSVSVGKRSTFLLELAVVVHDDTACWP
jgi:hypothetical protein